MICDYCQHDVVKTYRVHVSGDFDDHLCLACKRDVEYATSRGRIPQNPEDH